MCRTPVTLGGGIMMEKVSSEEALAPALKAPASSQALIDPGFGVLGVEGLVHHVFAFLVCGGI